MNHELTKLLYEVDEREGELLDLLSDLVAYPTMSPPARNAKSAQEYVVHQLKELNFTIDSWELYPGDPVVVGTKRGKQENQPKSLIINGHLDVAAIEQNERWDYNPFVCTVTEDKVFGRGVADMKGGIAGVLFAMKVLHKAGIEPGGNIYFQSVVGEEVGEAGTKSCCEKGYRADLALVVDTSDCSIQGQGGVITGWITIESPQTFHDASRRSMIHAGGGLHGASAIEKMMKIISALQELERQWAITKSSPGFTPGSNTINPAVIEGGRHAAFIADRCKLWITVHYYPEEHYEEVIREIEEHINYAAKADPWLKVHPPHFSWGGTSMIEDQGEIFPAFSVDSSHSGIQKLARAHQLIHETPVDYSMSPTVTDGGWLAEANIPTVLYGPGTLEQAHAVNESLEREQLLQFTKTMVAFLFDWFQHSERKDDR
ncbi:acetylornithine deacetylase [Halobacillus andaensis]|uniref:Acetylornithine deacetylase n=1 Tax=Halobacillus andaensis TaxID=1176239 RepID=A0A917B3Z2_HALAA|nr:acetylornithine deacetylase [Halobacillus andaensis]MBP2004621.1 acetylornithine deacetylase [Halobacillus andaensis]GGF20240.1 acetylornithine deacetylase [Halobacillus andaensis]